MSQDKEREIQLLFLEEAIEYLDTIESVLLSLEGSRHIDGQKMDAVLRAAHSVKGGAGMMGFQNLSQLAHRLEDSFKVLKAQRNSIEVDAELENLLLAAVDRLRQVLECNRQGTDVDGQWLTSIGQPVFEKLHARLGDPVADDAATMLGAEDGSNVAALLFETEVEGCLTRLEGVVADPQAPCLLEEVSIMAQELGGLGEMLQLDAFTQLCESIVQHLEAAPERVGEIAKLALNAWRRSQALVLVGQVSSLPDSIGNIGVEISRQAVSPVPETQSAHSKTPLEPGVEEHWLEEVFAAELEMESPDELLSSPEVTLPYEHEFASTSGTFSEEGTDESREETVAVPQILDFVSHEVQTAYPASTEASRENDNLEVFAAELDTEYQVEPLSSPEVSIHALQDPASSVETSPFVQAGSDQAKQGVNISDRTETNRSVAQVGQELDEFVEETVAIPQASTSLSREIQTDKREVQAADWSTYGTREGANRWREEKPLSASKAQPRESQENTVRIPVRQLDRLNDLFGELTIERNGLSLHLGRLRNLIDTLSRRVSTLEQSNIRLRTAYDTVTTQASAAPASEKSLVGFNAPNTLFVAQQPSNNTGDPAIPSGTASLNAKGDAFKAGEPKDNRTPALDNSTLNSPWSRFDALEMDRYSDFHLLSREVMETIVQIQEVTSDVGLSLEDTEQTARELNQTAKQLQTNLTRVRMRPLSDLVGRFSRALRDLSLQYAKQVELKVYGKGTLIDRSILEALSDPLMHLVRNAFDHGIEDPATRMAQGKPGQGVIEIKAAHRGNQTIITVSDDGNGINLNKIREKAEAMGLDAGLLAAASEDELLSLIFEPGFSTADRVTDLSGRGVGMDVVRNNLKQIRGDIRVDTQPGRGTTFTLTVPFTLSVARVLLVESNSMLLAFPTDVIEEMLLPKPEQILTTGVETSEGMSVLKWEGEMVPLTRLSAWLTFYCPRRIQTPEGVPTISEPTVLMINQGDQLHGIQVDRCWGEREVAIRQVEGTLALPPGFASCTILGDGKVVPLVDASELLRWIASLDRRDSPSWTTTDQNVQTLGFAALQGAVNQDSPASVYGNPSLPEPLRQKDTILVVDDSVNVRRFLALALEKAGYLVEQAKDGQDAVEKLLGGLQAEAVICDIEMPRLDGYGFLARVKSDPNFSELPIAMLTSRTGDKHRQLAMTLGAVAYFSKPYNERELLRTMREVITESRARKPIPSGVR
jgi:chemosensory pili system protein ChpA (sensor histidine kinase/response regulator)